MSKRKVFKMALKDATNTKSVRGQIVRALSERFGDCTLSLYALPDRASIITRQNMEVIVWTTKDSANNSCWAVLITTQLHSPLLYGVLSRRGHDEAQ